MSDWIFAAHVTAHCLLGCVIGEVAGLMIGVSIGLGTIHTMLLATVLAFITGLGLAVRAIIIKHGATIALAVKTIWLGEVISISVMEIAMNVVDYLIGGVGASSIFDSIFWIGLIFAIPAGYIAALPVNYWLVKRHLKKCH